MILTIGSVNIDHVYRLTALPRPGETIATGHYAQGLGGKGANQSLAARLAGAEVHHAGAIGTDGSWCRQRLADAGVDVADLEIADAPTGHAIILVDAVGENEIVIHDGANRALTPALIRRAIARARPGDWLLLQNETNLLAEAAQAGHDAGLRVAFAAAPFEARAVMAVAPHAELLAMNAVEATQLAAHPGGPATIASIPMLLITEGAEGMRCRAGGHEIHQPAFTVAPTDTTGAGDTCLGYFLAALDHGQDIAGAMHLAAAAAAIQTTRPGAADAIPERAEVLAFLAAREGA